MCYIIAPEEIKRKEDIVWQYKIGVGKFKDGTPDYIRQLDKEVLDFYANEVDGTQ